MNNIFKSIVFIIVYNISILNLSAQLSFKVQATHMTRQRIENNGYSKDLKWEKFNGKASFVFTENNIVLKYPNVDFKFIFIIKNQIRQEDKSLYLECIDWNGLHCKIYNFQDPVKKKDVLVVENEDSRALYLLF